MTIEQTLAVLSAVTALVSALAWPLLVLFIVLRFVPRVLELVGSGKDFTVKALGVEASFSTSVAKAAVALGAAEAHKAAQSAMPAGADAASADTGPAVAATSGPSMWAAPQAAADTVSKWLPTPEAHQQLQGATVLWVDEHPDNNRFERETFEAIGVRFELSTSTEDALVLLSRRRFDAIISDLARSGDRTAGYTLLDAVRKTDATTPYFVYTSSASRRDGEEARRRGAQGITNVPHELVEMVVQSLMAQRR